MNMRCFPIYLDLQLLSTVFSEYKFYTTFVKTITEHFIPFDAV